VVLEEYNHAVARGAKIYAEVCGYGNTCDAYHYTAPRPDGTTAAEAMRQALEEAGYRKGEKLHINAHGTGTPLNDKSETLSIKLAVGEEEARKVAICSTKSMTGHMLGGAGGVELVAAVMALNEEIIPPTVGLMEPDPECDLDYTPNTARNFAADIALSNSLGFGGHNGCIALRKMNL
jgi:3-oxoacyl-[acyl-carrier-protein] synthase II